jgi:hypothetical protein
MKLVSLPTLKTYLERTDTAQDPLLILLLETISKRIETHLNRELTKQARTEYFDAGRIRYFLPAYPLDLTQPFTVTYDGTAYTKDVDYHVWESDAMVEFVWKPAYNKPKQIAITWTGGYPEIPISQVLGSDNNNYTCILSHISELASKPIVGPEWETYWSQTGSAGVAWATNVQYVDHAYLEVPDDLQLATLMQVSHTFRRRRDAGLTSVSTPDGAKTFGMYAPVAFSPEALEILKNYRKTPSER